MGEINKGRFDVYKSCHIRAVGAPHREVSMISTQTRPMDQVTIPEDANPNCPGAFDCGGLHFSI